MTFDAKLLADVLDRPLDDAPRLALAATLTAAGDPRGEFIVGQCRLAERGLGPSERAGLKIRTAELLAAHGSTWTQAASGQQLEMRRGFIDEIAAAASVLAPKAAELFASEPVTRLTLNVANADTLAKLAGDGAFARVLRLTIRGTLGDAGAQLLADALSKRKTPLLSLNVGGTSIEEAGVAALAGALSGCRSWALTENDVTDEGLAAIAKSKALGSLETLFVTASNITDEGAVALSKSPALKSLSRLGVARNDELTSEGLRAIARSKKLKRLKWLEYSDEDGWQHVAKR
jgi:uncharacterized protein (TIGR02996 family)